VPAVVLEVLEGVAPFTDDEVGELLPSTRVEAVEPTEVRLAVDDADGDALDAVLGLRTVVAAYRSLAFDVPRPRSLRSPEHMAPVTDAVADLRRRARPQRFASFRLSAAGRDSEDLVLWCDAFAAATGLHHDPEAGDLLVRLRRPSGGRRGWEVLLRLTPRPLAARAWRVVDRPGALNATIAAALVRTTDPAADDVFVDLTCGTGTIVLERLARGMPARLVGIDNDPAALDAARANQRAARLRGRIEWIEADATALSLNGPAPNRLVANLPWGSLVGTHEENERLYPAVLDAAAAVAAAGATFSVLTHDLRRFDRALAASGQWAVDAEWRFFQKGHRPRLQRLVPAR
jgi:tRNA (guanine6-N2)-methyltransferase